MNHSPEPFDLRQLERRFFENFGPDTGQSIGSDIGAKYTEHPSAFHAPGRVNLIGEHTDYTGGMVFPCAIDRGTVLLIRRTGNHQYRFASTNFDLEAQLTTAEIGQTYGDSWINYPLGVIDQFRQLEVELDGFDCLYSGNVPNGAGLSSSAAIEVVTAFAINQLFDVGLELIDLAKLSQRAENDFVGMQCGIMDQFAVTMGKANHAMVLNCESLDYRHVPLELGENAIVLANTNQRRELNESAYNDRVKECARALGYVQQSIAVNTLGKLSLTDLNSLRAQFGNDQIAFQRARHVTSENTRVLAATSALESNDFTRFGQLMQASHTSLRDDFEVSSKPLDTLVSLALEHDGVLGARLTGAGFGGCTVNLLRKNVVASFQEHVGNAYHKATGLTADFYFIQPSNGVEELRT